MGSWVQFDVPPSKSYSTPDRIWSVDVGMARLVTSDQAGSVSVFDVVSGQVLQRHQSKSQEEIEEDNGVVSTRTAAAVACIKEDDNVFYAAAGQVFRLSTSDGVLYEETVPVSDNSPVACMDIRYPLVYVGYGDGKVRVWKNGVCKGRYIGHQASLRCLQISGHAMFTGSSDQCVMRWNTSTAKSTVLFRGTSGPIRQLYVQGDDLYFTNGNSVRLQSVSTGNLKFAFGGHTDATVSLAVDSVNQLLYTGGVDETIFVHSIVSGQTLCYFALPLDASQRIVKCLRLDTGFLFAAVGAFCYTWDVADVKQLLEKEGVWQKTMPSISSLGIGANGGFNNAGGGAFGVGAGRGMGMGRGRGAALQQGGGPAAYKAIPRSHAPNVRTFTVAGAGAAPFAAQEETYAPLQISSNPGAIMPVAASGSGPVPVTGTYTSKRPAMPMAGASASAVSEQYAGSLDALRMGELQQQGQRQQQQQQVHTYGEVAVEEYGDVPLDLQHHLNQ